MKGVRNRKPTKKKTSLSAFKTDYWGITVARKKKPTEFQKLHLVMIIPKGFLLGIFC